MQSALPLGMLLLLLPIVTSSGVHQIPLQLHHNYSALQRQLRASRYDVRDLHGKVGPTPVSLFNVFGLACLSLINIGSPGKYAENMNGESVPNCQTFHKNFRAARDNAL